MMDNLDQPTPSPLGEAPLMPDKRAYWRQWAFGAFNLGVASALPAYANWLLNTKVFGGWLGFFYSVGVVFYILFYFGRKAAAVADPEGGRGWGYSYSRAFGFAMLVSLGAAFVATVFVWLLNNVLAPELVQQALDEAAAKVREMPGVTEQAVQMGLRMGRFFLTFPGLLLANLFSMAITGGLIGLITASLVKRNPKI